MMATARRYVRPTGGETSIPRQLRSSLALGLGIVGLAAVHAGCAGRTADLSPASSEATRYDDIAVTEIGGVDIEIGTDAWTGRGAIRNHVTPLRVTIENEGEAPLQIRYSEFALIAPDGTRYAALPPFQVEGVVSERVETRYTPIGSPAFQHHGFYLSPHYMSIYPGIHTYDGFHHAGYYHDHYVDYWKALPLPTDEMLQRALPEGVVERDGRVSGFVYFERVDPRHDWVRFRADLIDAESGRVFGEISVRFEVGADYALVTF